MHKTAVAALCAFVSLLGSHVAPSPAAQSRPSTDPVSAALRDARGFRATDGVLRGIGPRYEVEVHADRVVFTPALGSAAPRTAEWTVGDARIARDGELELELRGGAVDATGTHAEVAFDGGVIARYEARADGLEQSFVLPSRPMGSGDLVVRQRVSTSWPLGSVDAHDGVEWGAAGLGGVRVGAVTAIAADGASCAGTLAFEAGVLEYRVPAAFVDAAAFPLLVDPLIGTLHYLGGDATNTLFDISPQVAYDASLGIYLVAWKRILAVSNVQVYAQRLNSNLQIVDTLSSVSAGMGADVDGALAIADSNPANAFVVAFERTFTYTTFGDKRGLVFRAMPAATAAIDGPPYTLTTTFDEFHSIALANQRSSSPSSNEIVAAYAQGGIMATPQISGRHLSVNPDMSITFGSAMALYLVDPSQEQIVDIELSRSGGTQARYLMAFTTKSGSPADLDVMARIIGEDLIVQTGAFAIANSASINEREPSVDGNGTEFVVAWEQAAQGSSDSSILVRRATLISSLKLDTPRTISALAGVAEADPALGYTGETYVLAWTVPLTASTDDLRVAALNDVTLDSCGTPASVSSATLDLRSSSITTRYASGVTADDALIVCEGASTATGATDIYGQHFETDNGIVNELGGGCGLFSGVAQVGCAISTASSIPLSLRNAITGVPAFLFLSATPLGFSEGGCTLHADPFSGFLVATGNTGSLGDKDFPLALMPTPSLIGVQFYLQWGTYVGGLGSFKIGGTPTGLNLSTAVKATFQ